MSSEADARNDLARVFRAAVAAVDAGDAVRHAFEEPTASDRRTLSRARVWVLAMGKAAAAMAAASESALGARLAGGLVVTKDGHGVPLASLPLREAGHPVPDARSERAAHEALALLAAIPPDDGLLVLLSGGASALVAGPAPGLALTDLAHTTRGLLAAGADIGELNAVRKHLSAVAGGRMAAATRAARICVWAISDVPGDRWDVIGSGPFCGDPTDFRQARRVLAHRGVLEGTTPAVRAHLEAGERGEVPDTPSPDDPALARVDFRILASNATAVTAACAEASRLGWRALPLPGGLTGEARVVGRRLGALARIIRTAGARETPLCLVAGGETTVTVRGSGRGGRSQELALAAAIEMEALRGSALLAAGTDGSDGPTPAAGAFADGGTLARGAAAGRDARAALRENDAFGFFRAEGGLLTTGPTHTNVMDLALLWSGRTARA